MTCDDCKRPATVALLAHLGEDRANKGVISKNLCRVCLPQNLFDVASFQGLLELNVRSLPIE